MFFGWKAGYLLFTIHIPLLPSFPFQLFLLFPLLNVVTVIQAKTAADASFEISSRISFSFWFQLLSCVSVLKISYILSTFKTTIIFKICGLIPMKMQDMKHHGTDTALCFPRTLPSPRQAVSRQGPIISLDKCLPKDTGLEHPTVPWRMSLPGHMLCQLLPGKLVTGQNNASY